MAGILISSWSDGIGPSRSDSGRWRKIFIDRPEPILDPPVEPEDDEECHGDFILEILNSFQQDQIFCVAAGAGDRGEDLI
jgi:hypothetical protein